MNEIEDKRKELERLCEMCKSKTFLINKRFGRKIYCDDCITERRKISQAIKPQTKEQRQAEYIRNKESYINRDKKRDNKIYSIRQKTAYLERIGKIKRTEECTFCLSKEDLVKHHPNYAEPNRIITLCRPCHNRLHNKRIEENVVNKEVIKEYYEKGKKEGVSLASQQKDKEFLEWLERYSKTIKEITYKSEHTGFKDVIEEDKSPSIWEKIEELKTAVKNDI